MDFSIRAARKGDISDITRLNAQLGYPEISETIATRFRRILRDRRDHRLFVAMDDRSSSAIPGSGTAVIGWVHVFIDKLLTVGPRAEIGGLVVDEERRRSGVGAALLLSAEKWSLHKGFAQIVVRTNIMRTLAHAFYERCGYELLKQSKVYTKEIR